MDFNHEQFQDACENDNIRVAKLIIETVLKHSPEHLMPMISSKCYYSLRWACEKGHLEVVKLLLSTVLQRSRGHLMPMIRSDDYYSLRWACENGHLANYQVDRCDWSYSEPSGPSGLE